VKKQSTTDAKRAAANDKEENSKAEKAKKVSEELGDEHRSINGALRLNKLHELQDRRGAIGHAAAGAACDESPGRGSKRCFGRVQRGVTANVFSQPTLSVYPAIAKQVPHRRFATVRNDIN
jgi:hypothetical protein